MYHVDKCSLLSSEVSCSGFGVCTTVNIGINKFLPPETIAQITGLHKTGHQTKDITKQFGVCEHSMRNLSEPLQDSSSVAMPTAKLHPGEPSWAYWDIIGCEHIYTATIFEVSHTVPQRTFMSTN